MLFWCVLIFVVFFSRLCFQSTKHRIRNEFEIQNRDVYAIENDITTSQKNVSICERDFKVQEKKHTHNNNRQYVPQLKIPIEKWQRSSKEEKNDGKNADGTKKNTERRKTKITTEYRVALFSCKFESNYKFKPFNKIRIAQLRVASGRSNDQERAMRTLTILCIHCFGARALMRANIVCM